MGLIQYSIEPKKLQQNARTNLIETSWHYVTGGKLVECTHSSDLLSAKSVKLGKQTILDLSKEQDSKAIVDLHPWCEYCPHGRSPENCAVKYKLDYPEEYLQSLYEEEIEELETKMFCGINDLVVTHEEVTRFESLFDSILTPPHLNPQHIGFCKELAVAVETWRAIFIYNRTRLQKTCKMTASTYIEEKYPGYTGTPGKGSGKLGRITVMLNDVPGSSWKEFLKKQNNYLFL